MRALSVFPAGFTADAARHLVGPDALDILEQLVDQSLLKVADTTTGTRFRMLETVREFGAAHQDDTGEVVDRFLAWAKDFGRTHHESVFSTGLVTFAEQTRADQDNLTHALRHALDRGDGATVAATMAVLGGLWIIESNFSRMSAMTDEAMAVLPHYHPEPGLVEVTRTALVLCAISGFILRTPPRPHRGLVALRRFPAAPPDTMSRAIQIVLCATPDPAAVNALCDSAEPLLAGLANYVMSYGWQGHNDLANALAAARRMLAAFDDQPTPWMRAVGHSRIAELCLQLDLGDEAVEHFTVALSAAEELKAWTTVTRARWVLVLANLQRGAVDEAEGRLDETGRSGADDGILMLDVAARAEIHLARGDVDTGLRLWRQVAEALRANGNLDGWMLETQSVAVVAHARHGRLDLVRDIVASLPDLLASRAWQATDFPFCGALLLAQATVDIHSGRNPSAGARMVALAERLWFVRSFQPTMSAALARRDAENADKAAYADAVSTYANLDHEGLRAAITPSARV
ncbi:hypothetical protein GCM10029964_079950 [Kibdelosporangium lantanae]